MNAARRRQYRPIGSHLPDPGPTIIVDNVCDLVVKETDEGETGYKFSSNFTVIAIVSSEKAFAITLVGYSWR